MTLFLLTALTMVAFAANSVFARVALAEGAIDAASYSTIRLVAGALTLALVAMSFRSTQSASLSVAQNANALWRQRGSYGSAFALLLYIAGFSYAYLALETGTGALILFACVQATMIGWGIYNGNRPAPLEWIGQTIAFGAFFYLVSPGLSAPDPIGALLMVAAGIGWGIYSLRGQKSKDPLLDTAGNFIWASLFMLVLMGVVWSFGPSLNADIFAINANGFGITMAVVSGAITSGCGYALWYHCLPQLPATKASIVQLSVPAIATIAGVALVSEPLTWRLFICSVLILGGVAIAVLTRGKKS